MCNDCKMTIITNPQSEMFETDDASLYDSEQDSDVTFVAGIDDDTYRFPGHRAVLASSNQVFQAMLCGPLSGEDVIYVKDVDKRAFEQLLKYLYGKPVSLPSVATARATLEAAHKYICPGLVLTCVSYLDLNLTPATVLDIFQDLRYFCSRVPTPNNVPTAPSLQAMNSNNNAKAQESMTEACDSLMHNCLLYIDDNADSVLQQERIEELSYYDVDIIAPRDTLNVTSEMELFCALSRWCKSECKRNKKELTSANRRQVLGELSYTVRYLLMTENEFITGPQASELLDLTECRLILAHMRGDKNVKFTKDQEEMLKRFKTPRSVNLAVQPINLSKRSEEKRQVTKDVTDSKNGDSKKKKKKNKKSKKELNDECDLEEKKNGCSCSCFGEGLLRAFVCLFD